MAWEGFRMVGASAASPEGVRWVYIDPMPKLVVAVQKLAVMTCTGVALPRCNTAAKIRGIAVALKNSIGHLTKNTITFYSELRFQ